ncbi:hypothetical protein M3M35_07165 [Fructilactobacillus myrtifloralis]|uniref:Uncharacterized protein n=1 Tax=Fructilactobacillus myrtifloralis TaxID=2940301 RepID=A0ABY5BR62_9LACO|nr:hypothetical protein [Fructilactobacillus myrtifloralis]USS85061.1 hypothetical protein M3M35_07165 [Fructilactobacillus myrtifloralis]
MTKEQKDCPYCNDPHIELPHIELSHIDIIGSGVTDDGMFQVAPILKGESDNLKVWDREDGRSYLVRINYCPMCGRSLDDNGKKTRN